MTPDAMQAKIRTHTSGRLSPVNHQPWCYEYGKDGPIITKYIATRPVKPYRYDGLDLSDIRSHVIVQVSPKRHVPLSLPFAYKRGRQDVEQGRGQARIHISYNKTPSRILFDPWGAGYQVQALLLATPLSSACICPCTSTSVQDNTRSLPPGRRAFFAWTRIKRPCSSYITVRKREHTYKFTRWC